ncbi:MAG TPA: hypothetical protein VFW35_10045 [Sphingomicrobium sp.]|nr:hypothetical protein [Sphingomicrobium sp.]
MTKPFTRTQVLQNRAFLKALRRTANVRLACREVGLKYGTMQDRRRKHRSFALRWDAELVAAQARLERRRRGRAHPSPSHPRSRGDEPLPLPQGGEGLFRTAGGEAVVVRLASGKLQMRRAQPGKLTPAAEQAFLAALSVTCNIALSAAAVGAAEAAFHRRKRNDPGFAREMRMALKRGYMGLELALLASSLAGSHEHDDWRNNDTPAMPPMTPSQALQLLYLHQKEARLIAEPPHIRRRPGESREAHSERLTAMAEERRRLAREAFEVAEVERWERGEPAWGPAGEEVRRELGLPDLAQVTGWSHADPAKAPHHPERALFGGWRIEDLERKKAGRAGK